MVQECMEIIDDLTWAQADFIENLFKHSSPDENDFIEETSDKQRAWLYAIWDFHCNGNFEAFEEYREEWGSA